MIPIMLNPALVRVGVCGEGPLTLRRFNWLRDCGADPIVFAPDPSPELELAAITGVKRHLPSAEDVKMLAVLWIADFEAEIANPLAELARSLGVLVNVEDVLPFCDFHTPAIVHRGRLTLAISTGGASPAIASTIRKRLEASFPKEWEDLLEEIAVAREILRSEGARFPELLADAQKRLEKSGL